LSVPGKEESTIARNSQADEKRDKLEAKSLPEPVTEKEGASARLWPRTKEEGGILLAYCPSEVGRNCQEKRGSQLDTSKPRRKGERKKERWGGVASR